ncbi:MAG: chromosome segregation protein SMC [Oscillospiraceae bacterium]|nr:chromosome segregation protein SMC [Oscillospiraceae bacterium]MBQ4642596.1 chromosome segregation protein SMC [Oscillospiraceae bacterium]
MFLKYLELSGFKSFPDKTKLNFGRGMTAVVGPNGSGKSNISDAVRWVLGEMSTKALRGGKMEDVIFNGTRLRRAHGFAEVRICFDNTDRALPLDTDEVIVSRKYYRNGDSDYRINEKTSRLKDINELFMDTGLGRDGYSIIGQGKISEIVSAKPNQRREIFEEASGISKFRYRKEEAEKSLSRADENLLRLRDNLSALEERVGPLLEQSEKAKKFLELSEEKRSLEISVWMRSLRRLKAQLAEQSGTIAVFQGEYDALDADYNDAENRINALYEQLRDIDTAVEEKREKISENEAALGELTAKAAVCQNDIEHNNSEISRIDEEIASLSSDSSEGDSAIELRKKELEAKEAEAKKLSEKEGLLKKQGEEISAEKAAANGEKSAIEAKVSETETELGHISVVLATARNDKAQYSERLEQLSLSASQKLSLIDGYKTELIEVNDLLEEIEDKTESINNSKAGMMMKRDLRKKQLAEMDEKRNKIRRDADSFTQKAKLLQDLERNMEGFGQSVKYVLDRGAAGSLRGILEPVSKILSVDAKYSLAVETAVGAALQNIVVTDEDAAKKAIRMLKEQGRGRVTFLPLTSVKGNRLEERGLSDCEGFVGIGCDLVKNDPKYDGIVKSVLGRIVVAEDLDCAVAIAKKYGYKFRIVTLDGQLVNAGGSLTGGSSVKSAGILSRKQEIEELLKKAAAAEKLLSDGEGDYNKLREEISAMEADSLATESELRTLSEDKIRAEGEKKRLLMQISDAQAAGTEAETQRGIFEKAIAEAENRIGEYEALLSERTERKNRLLAEISAADEKIAAVTEKESANLSEISAIALSSAIVLKDMEAIENAIAQLLENRGQREEKIASLNERKALVADKNAALSDEIKGIEDEKLRLSNLSEESRTEITALFAQRQDFEKNATDERTAQKNIVSRREEASVKLVKARTRLDEMQVDYDRIIGQLWDEYEMTYSRAEEVAEEITEPQKAQRRLSELRSKIKALGSVNLSAIEEFKEVSERYEFMKTQIEDAEKSRDELRSLIRNLMGQMRTIFLDRFTQISGNFTVVFKELFGGGEAKLFLTDPDNVLESGIEITVQPPGKIINNLASLSGGEQTFVAIAIYFAILKVRPAPFCILDEIEAALDEANVDRYADYLLRLTENTQFIAITHRRGTMEHADRLYGVTMQEEGVSKLLELTLAEVENIEK